MWDTRSILICVFFLQASGGVCPVYCLDDRKNMSWVNAWEEGTLGEEPAPGLCSDPESRPRIDKGAVNTHTGCGFSWSDDSFQLTKDSGQGSEKSGWLIHPYDFTLQRTRRGVTLQNPEALQWEGAQWSGCNPWAGRIRIPALREPRMNDWKRIPSGVFPFLTLLPAKHIHKALFRRRF